MHRLRVDWIRCEGYGLCGDYAPGVIELDEWRYPILRGDPVDQSFLNEVQRAIDCCPMKALALEAIVDDRGRRIDYPVGTDADALQRRRASSLAS